MVKLASFINSYGNAHWKLFAGQNYFDEMGVFMSIMFSTPLLLVCLVIVIQGLFDMKNLMVLSKQVQLKRRAQSSNKAAADSDDSKQKSRKVDAGQQKQE